MMPVQKSKYIVGKVEKNVSGTVWVRLKGMITEKPR